MVNDEIREITSRFVEALHPEQVILFGSYATDTYQDDSDYDFYIVMADDALDDVCASTAAAYNALNDMYHRKAVDILMGTQSKFSLRSAQPTIERRVKREGIVLYGQ